VSSEELTAGLTVLVGFVSGVLSGMFGIGGGVITTPAIRWLLGAPALIAVGTPLPVILPTAVTGAIAYARRGLADVRSGLVIGLVGAGFAVGGALLATRVGGTIVLLCTGLLILIMAADLMLQAVRPQRVEPLPREPLGTTESDEALVPGAVAALEPTEATPSATRPGTPPGFARLAVLGAVTGLYSGFLGLGGGFVVVPMLTRWFRFPIKLAIGTSLVAVALLAVPGSITHYLLGNVDLELTALLIVGVVPGALVGARITFGASEKAMRIAFAALLVVVGIVLLVTESGVLS